MNSTNCLVRVTAYGATGWLANDASDGVFTIQSASPAGLTVTAPNGGERLTGGNTYTIQWTGEPGATQYLLRYSIDAGASWTSIATVGAATEYLWSVPLVNSANCLIRVTAYGATGWLANDASDGVFAIQSASTAVSEANASNGAYHQH